MQARVAFLFFALAAVGASAVDPHESHQTKKRDVNSTEIYDYHLKRSSRSILGRLFSPTQYICDFLPNVSFFPEIGSPLPVYRCVLDSSEVLIATSSFHSSKDRRDFVTRASVLLDAVVLRTIYPGTFRATDQVLFRGAGSSNSFSSPVAINGLLILSTPNLKTGLLNYFSPERYSCEFLPFVNFYVDVYGQLPAYKCIHGNNEVLIATSSFKYNQKVYINNVDISLNDVVLKTKYPGSFIQVARNNYTSVTGLNYVGTGVGINGLLPLTT